MTKKKFDFNSIQVKIWAMFLLFTLLIIGLIWLLQILFMNTYYDRMKLQETIRSANDIKAEYVKEDYDMSELTTYIEAESTKNDMTIIISDLSVSTVLLDTGLGPMSSSENNLTFQVPARARYYNDMLELAQKLNSDELKNAKVEDTIEDDPRLGRNRTLKYACYLKNPDTEDTYIMYMFSPLYPVQTTVKILRSQLIYITVIAILLAVVLSIYLARRISRPISQISSAAAEMGKGNYGVKFKGGSFSEINELADTLTRAESELEKTDMYQKDLIANVSHDLRTPLTMIKSYAEMIRDLSGNNPEKRESHLAVIIEETDRLNSLVNDMLDLSRMQSKTIELEQSDFDMGKAAEEIMAAYDILKLNEGYNIIFNCTSEILSVNGDETKIKQVMTNLVNNAVKYCGEDKTIIVNVYRSGKKAHFEVVDHGQGIAPDEITHVWERYYKSSTNHARPTEGSGLGLSIVKEILNLHKADFDVESTVGKGSKFWFDLPVLKTKR